MINWMAFADQFLIYTFTLISVFITAKSVKTAIFELARFSNWVFSKLKQTYYMIFPGREPYTSNTSLGRLLERSKSTLMPFISRDYFKAMRKKRLVGIGYLLTFLFGIFLIFTFFWAFFQADLTTVLNNSPYLIGPIENFLINYQTISKTISALFIFGFIVEVFNSLRSLLS